MRISRQKKFFVQILNRFRSGHATPDEAEFVNMYLDRLESPQNILDTLGQEKQAQLETEIHEQLSKSIHRISETPVRQLPSQTPWKRIMAAASLLLVIGTGVYYFSQHAWSEKNNIIVEKKPTSPAQDIAPGFSGAILTLADGSQINLDNTKNGRLTMQGNSGIFKNSGGIKYSLEKIKSLPVTYNTITTPKGREFQLELADGTKVWLNAASTITFPTAFTGKERKVTMTGEAYFEVAKNAALPFTVTANEEEVTVLGTHFNINAYDNETIAKTTLVEGSVKVSNGNETLLLKPGEQAQLQKSGKMEIAADADVDLALAWKNGLISFKSADIKAIMRQVERWYNVEVKYSGEIPERSFTGDIPKNSNLSELLRLLEASKIHFAIDGNVLTVMP